MKIHNTYIFFCIILCLCLTTTPCFADTGMPLFMILPFFLQSGPFIDMLTELSGIIQNISGFTIENFLLSAIVGLVLFGVVAGIEYHSLHKTLQIRQKRKLWSAVLLANVISTITAIPVGLFFRNGIEDWAIVGPLAIFPKTQSIWVVLLIYLPLTFAMCLYATYYIENIIIARFIKPKNELAFKKAVWFANIKGYAYPVIGVLTLLIIASFLLR